MIGGYASSYLNTVQYAPINANGTVGAWTATISLPSDYAGETDGMAAIAYNGYMYILGGSNGGANYPFNEVTYAPIHEDGTIGSWTSTNSFPTVGSNGAPVAYNGYMYMTGGVDGPAGNVLNTTEYAPINANGSLGTWATAATTFNTARVGQTAVAYEGYLYVTGGENTARTPINTTEYAPINANGNLGNWTTTTSFPTSTYADASVAYNGYLYVVGGYTSTFGFQIDTANVQYAPLNNGGSGNSGSWTTNGTSFTTARQSQSSVAYNGYLYVMAGNNGTSTTVYNDVQYAQINANGSLGTWAATTSIPGVRYNAAAVAYNGYLYIMGGTSNGTTSFYNDVQYAPINANGSLGTWAATTSFANARQALASVAYNGYLYILGGANGTGTVYNDVQYAPINSNGTIGAWAATTSFNNVRYGQGSFEYNGYLYVMGGNSGTTNYSDTQYAPINSNGTIGSWAATTSLPSGRSFFASAASNGYVYVVGGVSNLSGFLTDAEYAPINANGGLGNWTTTPSLSTARFSLPSVIYNGYIYIDGSGPFGDTQYASLNSMDRVGVYSKLIDLGSTTTLSSITYDGTVPNGLSAISYTAWDGIGTTITGSGLAGTLGSGSRCSSGTLSARYLFVRITLDDSQSGVFPDNTGTNNANVQDFTINYAATSHHPAPNIRLRAGQMLQLGSLSPLDTCGVGL